MSDYSVEAVRIHRDLPVVDGHNDLPWEIRTRADGSLDTADPTSSLPGYHTDFPRLLAGGVGVQFWSVYVPAWSRTPLADTHRQIDLVLEMTRRGREFTAMAGDAEQAMDIRNGGRVAGLMGAEGGHCIENSLDSLRDLAERGVRYLTLTHADTLDWADSATDEPRSDGLSPFGEEVVAEMNRLGMLVDISHVSAQTMRHALEVSKTPVIASHSSAYSIARHPRNVPDDVLEGVADNEGVVMVNFCSSFVVPETAQKALDMFDEERRIRATFAADDEAGYQKARRARSRPEMDRGSVDDVLDHVEHVAEVAGIEHVGLGSDFDGVDLLPDGLDDVSCYPAITDGLIERGWAEADIRLVLGGNALRVLAAADAGRR